jgi:hypothetical protein
VKPVLVLVNVLEINQTTPAVSVTHIPSCNRFGHFEVSDTIASYAFVHEHEHVHVYVHEYTPEWQSLFGSHRQSRWLTGV